MTEENAISFRFTDKNNNTYVIVSDVNGDGELYIELCDVVDRPYLVDVSDSGKDLAIQACVDEILKQQRHPEQSAADEQ